MGSIGGWKGPCTITWTQCARETLICEGGIYLLRSSLTSLRRQIPDYATPSSNARRHATGHVSSNIPTTRHKSAMAMLC